MDRIFTFCVHFRHEKIKSKTSSGDRNARRIWGPRCSTRYHFSSSQARWLFYRRWNCQWGECLYRFQWHSIRLLRELVTTSVHGVMPFVLSTANRVSHLSLLSNSTPCLNRFTEGSNQLFWEIQPTPIQHRLKSGGCYALCKCTRPRATMVDWDPSWIAKRSRWSCRLAGSQSRNRATSRDTDWKTYSDRIVASTLAEWSTIELRKKQWHNSQSGSYKLLRHHFQSTDLRLQLLQKLLQEALHRRWRR